MPKSTVCDPTWSQKGMVIQQPAPTTTPTNLPAEISLATKPYHTSLNRLITSRLSLCLPPSAPTPHLYTVGFHLFAQIYTTFESEWAALLLLPIEDIDRPNARVTTFLRTLHVQALLRDQRLHNDLAILSYTTAAHDVVELTRRATIFFNKEYRAQISRAVQDRPHILLAYTWVMYMALFNGGRWIRSQLTDAGPDFWQPTSDITITATNAAPPACNEGLEPECLSFWRFEGSLDGNDIKDDFKGRFDAAALRLTPAERQDVVDEAVAIFKMCHTMVSWLDTNISPPSAFSPPHDNDDNVSTPWYLLAYIWVLSLLFRTILRLQKSWLSIYAALAAANASLRRQRLTTRAAGTGYIRVLVEKDDPHSD